MQPYTKGLWSLNGSQAQSSNSTIGQLHWIEIRERAREKRKD